MINTLKTPASILLILSACFLTASVNNGSGDKNRFNEKPSEAFIETGTPVYEIDSNRNRQVAILEKDFPKVAVNFSITFPGASNQLWIIKGKSLFVYFKNSGGKVSAVFNLSGRMNYAISVIGETEIPENIIRQIKKEYPRFSFFSAKKIHTRGYTSYELVLESNEEFIKIGSTGDDEIVMTKKICK